MYLVGILSLGAGSNMQCMEKSMLKMSKILPLTLSFIVYLRNGTLLMLKYILQLQLCSKK